MQESPVNKDGLTFYKGFMLLSDTNSDDIEQLKLPLPTGHISISVKNCIWRLSAGNYFSFSVNLLSRLVVGGNKFIMVIVLCINN
jgi:hypothetical protein